MSQPSPPKTKSLTLPDMSSKQSLDNFVTRKKKTDDLKLMIQDMKIEQSKKLKKMEEGFLSMKKQNDELKLQNEEIIKSNTEIKNALQQYVEMFGKMKEVTGIKEQLNSATMKINELEDQVQNLERIRNSTMIEISNCPDLDENKLQEVATKLHAKVEVPLKLSAVRQVYQIKTSPRKTVVVEYQSSQHSKAVLKAVKNYNKANNNEKLNSTSLGIPGSQAPIYVSESLTQLARKIFFNARQIQKKYDYRYCWTAKGIVYIRKSEDSPVIQLKTAEQLEKIQKLVETAEA